MALSNVIGQCKRHVVINAVPLFEQTLCLSSLFVCKCGRLDNFSTSDREREMNVNISNELNFCDVHGAMNHSGSPAKQGSFTLHATHCGS